MPKSEFYVFMPILILMALTTVIVFGAYFVSRIVRPAKPTKLKLTAYECGELPTGTAWSQFNVRFYVVGLIFIIFDVESVLMFPVVTIFKKFNASGYGGLILFEVLIFIFILVAGIAYCWKKGDLDWVKSFQLKTSK